jgi:hypothetical protein
MVTGEKRQSLTKQMLWHEAERAILSCFYEAGEFVVNARHENQVYDSAQSALKLRQRYPSFHMLE